jgi:dihydroorotate dehydrogenase (NAD+) catalytic subunit
MRRGEIPSAPILGIGGINTGLDVARFVMLGASAVQIGSALIWGDVEKFKEISVELSEFMDLNGYRDISSMQGIALDSLEGLS